MKTTLPLTGIALVATLIASSANADCIIDSRALSGRVESGIPNCV